jgi:hypothetical protein
MAIFIPSGSIVAAINGTVDGLVYYRGRYGNVIRRWVNPVNTVTAPRTTWRATFRTLISAYNGLTQPQRDAWNSYADQFRLPNRLGSLYGPSGIQIFMTRNLNLSVLGLGPISAPPLASPLNFLGGFTATTFSSLHLNVIAQMIDGTTNVPAGHSLVYAGTTNQVPHKQTMYNRFRILANFPPATAMAQDLITAWSAVYGIAPISTKKIFVKAYLINRTSGEHTFPSWSNQIVS